MFTYFKNETATFYRVDVSEGVPFSCYELIIKMGKTDTEDYVKFAEEFGLEWFDEETDNDGDTINLWFKYIID